MGLHNARSLVFYDDGGHNARSLVSYDDGGHNARSLVSYDDGGYTMHGPDYSMMTGAITHGS